MAQFNLGYMYQKGIGIPQDYIIAHMWYFLSGSNGYNDAVNSRNKLEDMMTPQQIEYAQRNRFSGKYYFGKNYRSKNFVFFANITP